MPYGVPDEIWKRLPADDQAAIIATSQGLAPPQIGGYAIPPPSAAGVPAEGAWVQEPGGTRIALNQGGSIHYAAPDLATFVSHGGFALDVYQVSPAWWAAIPWGSAYVWPPPVAAAPAPDTSGLREFVATNADEVAVADVVLPSTAWATLRDYLTGVHPELPNLPAKRQQIEAHGRNLGGVVASDLWRRRNP